MKIPPARRACRGKRGRRAGEGECPGTRKAEQVLKASRVLSRGTRRARGEEQHRQLYGVLCFKQQTFQAHAVINALSLKAGESRDEQRLCDLPKPGAEKNPPRSQTRMMLNHSPGSRFSIMAIIQLLLALEKFQRQRLMKRR